MDCNGNPHKWLIYLPIPSLPDAKRSLTGIHRRMLAISRPKMRITSCVGVLMNGFLSSILARAPVRALACMRSHGCGRVPCLRCRYGERTRACAGIRLDHPLSRHCQSHKPLDVKGLRLEKTGKTGRKMAILKELARVGFSVNRNESNMNQCFSGENRGKASFLLRVICSRSRREMLTDLFQSTKHSEAKPRA